MKDIKLLILTLVILVSVKTHGQLKVSNNGSVGIALNSGVVPLSKLSVGDIGNAYSIGYFFNSNSTASLNIGLSSEAAPGNSSFGLSGYVTMNTSANNCKGVWGSSYSSTPLSNGRAYGVYGYAGNATSGYNYGVYGQLAGSNNGAAIYGVVPGYGDVNTLGQYAGYFLGNVMVSGHLGINTIPNTTYDITTNYYIGVAGVTVGSDQRLKDNIKDLSGALTSLSQLKGVTYRLKPREIDNANLTSSTTPDTGRIQSSTQIIDTAKYNRNHIGFLAQDVQKIFPELVFTDGDGMLSVDYISLIPVLVESIKEINRKHVTDSLNLENKILLLKNKIDKDSVYFETKLKSLVIQLNQCCGASQLKNVSIDNSKIEGSNITDGSILFQNTPNPFNQSTTISYYLALNVRKATIYIYNLQGTQLKSIPVIEHGNGNILINGSELNPGMYIYALIVDGKEIDTKRMILTQ